MQPVKIRMKSFSTNMIAWKDIDLKITILQTFPRSESLYAFLSSLKTKSGRNIIEVDVDETKDDVLRDLRGCMKQKSVDTIQQSLKAIFGENMYRQY